MPHGAARRRRVSGAQAFWRSQNLGPDGLRLAGHIKSGVPAKSQILWGMLKCDAFQYEK